MSEQVSSAQEAHETLVKLGMARSDTEERIVVRLPLTLSVSTAVLGGIGHYYPNAKVIMDPAVHKEGPDVMVIVVDHTDRIDYDAGFEDEL